MLEVFPIGLLGQLLISPLSTPFPVFRGLFFYCAHGHSSLTKGSSAAEILEFSTLFPNVFFGATDLHVWVRQGKPEGCEHLECSSGKGILY